MNLLIYPQYPRYTRPARSWPDRTILGGVSKPVPPGPFLPGFLTGGGGGFGEHTSFHVERGGELHKFLDRQEQDDLIVLFLVWLLIENGMSYIATDVIARRFGEFDDEDMLPFMLIWLEVTR